MLTVSSSLISAIVLAVLPALVSAQAIEIGPSVGYYRPLGGFDAASLNASDLPTRPSQLSGVAWGADLRTAFRNRMGIEATFSTIASTLPPFGNPGSGTAIRTDERVNVLTLEAQYDLGPTQGSSQLLVSAGPAMIQHRGEGYSRYGSPGSWGGGVGLEFVRAMTPQLQIAANLRGLIYAFNLASAPQHGTQFDGLVALGVRWHVPLRTR